MKIYGIDCWDELCDIGQWWMHRRLFADKDQAEAEAETLRTCNDGVRTYADVIGYELVERTGRNVAVLNRDGVAGYYFTCSECGTSLTACFGVHEIRYTDECLRSFHMLDKYKFLHCPACGAKVVER